MENGNNKNNLRFGVNADCVTVKFYYNNIKKLNHILEQLNTLNAQHDFNLDI